MENTKTSEKYNMVRKSKIFGQTYFLYVMIRYSIFTCARKLTR